MKKRLIRRANKISSFLLSVFRSYADHECPKQAAALAYYGVFSIFPLLLFLVYIGSVFLSQDSTYRTLNNYLFEVFPAGATNISDIINQTLRSRGTIGIVSGISLLWSGSSVFSVLASSLSRIWGTSIRPFWRRRALATLSVLVLGLVFLSSFLIGPLSNWIFNNSVLSGFRAIGYGIEIITFAITALLLYRIFPNMHVRWGPAFLGAMICGILFVITKFIFGLYMNLVLSRFGLVYGSLAWFLTIALWVYVIAVLILLGAEFAAEFQKKEIV